MLVYISWVVDKWEIASHHRIYPHDVPQVNKTYVVAHQYQLKRCLIPEFELSPGFEIDAIVECLVGETK
jgi:hypothetical protein